MVADDAVPDPTMEQAFIRLIERQNALQDDTGAGGMRRLWALARRRVTRSCGTRGAADYFVLPPILLFLFAFAVSLDVKDVRVGVVLESDGADARSLWRWRSPPPFLRVTPPGTGRH